MIDNTQIEPYTVLERSRFDAAVADLLIYLELPPDFDWSHNRAAFLVLLEEPSLSERQLACRVLVA